MITTIGGATGIQLVKIFLVLFQTAAYILHNVHVFHILFPICTIIGFSGGSYLLDILIGEIIKIIINIEKSMKPIKSDITPIEFIKIPMQIAK